MDTKFWDGKRPEGVANTINPDSFPNVLSLINGLLSTNSSRPAFTGIGHTLTYSDIDNYSRQFAAYLQNTTSLQPGDRIAIQMPNLLQYSIAVYGAFRAGLVVVNTNPLYTAREMLHQFRDSGAKALVYLENFAHLVETVVAETDIEVLIVTQLADMLPTPKRQLINFLAKRVKKMVPPHHLTPTTTFLGALKAGRGMSYQSPEEAALDDAAVLQYTGGTTGVAKGAELTHRNLISNMLQAKEAFCQTEGFDPEPLIPGKEIIVAPLPLYHIYAFTVHLLAMPYLGNQNILIANPRDTATFIKFIKPWRFSGFIGLNTLFVSLMNHPEFARCDFSGLKFTLSGGTALQEDTGLRWQEFTGCHVSEAYGLTECTPAVCINPLGKLSKLGTAGLPVASTALKIINSDGSELPLGDVGELCVKGPQVMKGYWGNEEATWEVISEDGWLKTGDVAMIQEDGFVKIVDRIKDMILVSGFNVYPNEVEDVVSGCQKVENCAVIGVPDTKTGEAVKLFVVASDASLTEEELIEFCRDRLAAYKVPRQVVFREELPMTPVGKVLRKDLRKEELKQSTH